jgi:hypothetical protein
MRISITHSQDSITYHTENKIKTPISLGWKFSRTYLNFASKIDSFNGLRLDGCSRV